MAALMEVMSVDVLADKKAVSKVVSMAASMGWKGLQMVGKMVEMMVLH